MLATTSKSLSHKKENFYSLLLEELALNFYKINAKDLVKLKNVCEDYFKCALIIDNLVDNSISKYELIQGLAAFTEKYRSAIKTLRSLYPDESVFWNQFASNEQDHFHYLIKEQEMAGNLNMEESTYFTLACGKSVILCSNVVTALASLSGNSSESHNRLLEFIRKIHIAFQLQDDVDDFNIDMESGQLSLAVNTVKQQLIQHLGSVPGTEFVKKFFFTSGIAQHLLAKAVSEYDECSLLLQDFSAPKLLAFCNRERDKINAQIYEIALIVNKARVKAKQSNIFVGNQIHAKRQMQAGANYLSEHLKEDKWQDFMTSAGSGTEWVTAFVAHSIAYYSCPLTTALPRIIKNITKQSYNETIPLDVDSLQFFLIASNQLGIPISIEHRKSFLSFQQPDGGFSTYRDEEVLRKRLSLEDNYETSGWLSSHVCVSAVSAYILYHQQDSVEQFKKLIYYLITNQFADGCWKSYWWSSDVYATSWAVISLSQAGIYQENAMRGKDWLANNQHQEGYWLDDIKKEHSCFFTALALQGLMTGSSRSITKYEDCIFKGIFWLLAQQTLDGSWPSSRILAIPAPNVKKRDDVMHWRKSSLGVNVIVDDHVRIFTTATVINTLDMFKRVFYDRG
jgi:hypothetical protein